jgi:hypothetical protein
MSAALSVEKVQTCTTILVGKAATVDGSVLMATSCDGNIMGRVYVCSMISLHRRPGADGAVGTCARGNR